MSDLNIRQNAEINELERLKNRPDEVQSQMKSYQKLKALLRKREKMLLINLLLLKQN